MPPAPPKISIVTPCYNHARFVEATIQSVLSQNYPNLEYIVIDGGSTDGSREIISKYHRDLHFWCSEPDAGQYDAINKGFSHATGDILAWINSDDMYYPWTFKTIASVFSERPEVEWLTTLSPGFWDCHGFCSPFPQAPGFSKQSFLEGCHAGLDVHHTTFIQQESTFWRRGLWQRAGAQINPRYKLAGDFNLWASFFPTADLYALESPLGGFRVHENQRSHDMKAYLRETDVSLAALRASLGWEPSPWMFLATRLQPYRHLLKTLGRFNPLRRYRGKRIVRKNSPTEGGTWEVQDYRF